MFYIITKCFPEFKLKRLIDDVCIDQLKTHFSYEGHIFNRFSWGIDS